MEISNELKPAGPPEPTSSPAGVPDRSIASPEMLEAITTVLADLIAFTFLITKLIGARRMNLVFVTPERLAAESEMYAKEQKQRREALKLGAPTGRGASPAPGSLAALAVDIEVWTAAAHQVRRLNRHIARTRGVTRPSPPTDAPTPVLLAHIGDLIGQVRSARVLQATLDDLQHAHDVASQFINGETRARFPGACPHCQQQTLVVNFQADEIRCDRHPRTGHYMPCTCTDPTCACKRNPIGHRHTWTRLGKGANSWYGLGDRISLNRLARKEP